FARSFAVPR
ncbi:hypothetical protein ACHAW5_009252, partial [Stephanodiscus triporus]